MGRYNRAGVALGFVILLGSADLCHGQEAASPEKTLAALAQQAGATVDSDAAGTTPSRARSARKGFVRGATAGAVFGAVAVAVLSKANGGGFVTNETWKAAAVVGGIWGAGGAALGAAFPSKRSTLALAPDFGRNHKRVLVRIGW